MVGFTTSSNPKKIGNLDEFGQILLKVQKKWDILPLFFVWHFEGATAVGCEMTLKTSSNFPSGNISVSRGPAPCVSCFRAQLSR
jgi:hypothetical protein